MYSYIQSSFSLRSHNYHHSLSLSSTMESRSMEITVISAENLKNVNLMSKMDVYVVVSISGDHRSKCKTPVHHDGGTNPKWNHRLNFSIHEAALSQNPSLSLLFQIRSDRSLGDKDIGDVSVPIRELLDSNSSSDGSDRVVEYQVRTASGKPKGMLKFSYKFGEKIAIAAAAAEMADPKAHAPVAAYPHPPAHTDPKGHEPVTAYPPQGYANPPPQGYANPPPQGYANPPPQGYANPPPQGYANPPPQGYAYPPPQGYAYPPPPQQGYAYPPPPQGQYGQPGGGSGYPAAGYGYAAPAAGYGYAPAVQQPKKKKGSKLGLGLGAGLLGGLLVGDMISDIGESSYDGGFDDMGDF